MTILEWTLVLPGAGDVEAAGRVARRYGEACLAQDPRSTLLRIAAATWL